LEPKIVFAPFWRMSSIRPINHQRQFSSVYIISPLRRRR